MSAFLHEMLPDEPEPSRIVRGKVATAAASLSDRIFVTLAEFDPDLRFGPCRWMARDSTSLPGRGNSCLVVFDNTGEPWVVAWWPFT